MFKNAGITSFSKTQLRTVREGVIHSGVVFIHIRMMQGQAVVYEPEEKAKDSHENLLLHFSCFDEAKF